MEEITQIVKKTTNTGKEVNVEETRIFMTEEELAADLHKYEQALHPSKLMDIYLSYEDFKNSDKY